MNMNMNMNSMPQPLQASSNNILSTCSLPFPSWHDNNDEELPLPGSWCGITITNAPLVEAHKLEKDQMLRDPAPLVHPHVLNQQSYVSAKPSWSQILVAAYPPPDQSNSQYCTSNATGGPLKKARVQPFTTQSTFKVRKEKLGDRITALHQLVSPFGKTDTASVLLEAIGYIRFLQNQIEALSLPYLGKGNGSGNMRHQLHDQVEKNCIFPEDPGQLLSENCLKRKAANEKDSQEEVKKDLRSRGLCLVPMSCTLHVVSDYGADYWAPAFGTGEFL